MNQIKLTGIVIKEVTYKDNDKIITILTDSLGKISCMAKGSKKTNSPLLASSQYLVYSEFVLNKGSHFYYVNSTSVINTFYKLRTDLDKLEFAFDMTKILNNITDENQETKSILKLFLNTLYLLQEEKKQSKFLINIFKIKMLSLMGFSIPMGKCASCMENLKEDKDIYYDYISNILVCEDCYKKQDLKRYIKLSSSTFKAIKYTIVSDISKVFNFTLTESGVREYAMFGQAFLECLSSGI